MMTLELADGRIPVIAGTGANATAEAISLTKRFNDSGVVGCLTVTPYYNRPTQKACSSTLKLSPNILTCRKFCIMCRPVPVAICCRKPLAVWRKLKILSVLKEATGNLSRVHQIKELVSDDFILLSGDDATGMDFMQLGGVGVISVTANVAAREMADMCRLALAGQFAEARAINQRLMPLHTKLFVEPNPIPVKWGCKALGLVATDTLRLPMTPITDRGREAVTAALKHAGLL